MGFVVGAQLLALLSLAIVPASDAAPPSVTLASGASRTCTGETRVRMVSSRGQPVASAPEQTAPMSETLSARLADGRYEIRRTSGMEGGQALLIAHIRPDGTVIDANMTGSLPMIGSGERLQRMSMLAARMLPERLVMARAFNPGDNLYAGVDMQDIVAGLLGAMPLPASFQFQATGTMPFTGATGGGSDRSLNFAGPIHVSGGGVVNGQTMTLESSGRASIAVDATTGLMRNTITEATIAVRVNGAPLTEMQMSQNMTCTISPAA
jgi:hypothetical protein